jgi:hypothetical protein
MLSAGSPQLVWWHLLPPACRSWLPPTAPTALTPHFCAPAALTASCMYSCQMRVPGERQGLVNTSFTVTRKRQGRGLDVLLHT